MLDLGREGENLDLKEGIYQVELVSLEGRAGEKGWETQRCLLDSAAPSQAIAWFKADGVVFSISWN